MLEQRKTNPNTTYGDYPLPYKELYQTAGKALDFKTVKRDKWHAKQSANARYVCRVSRLYPCVSSVR
jgi:hypothetical protein